MAFENENVRVLADSSAYNPVVQSLSLLQGEHDLAVDDIAFREGLVWTGQKDRLRRQDHYRLYRNAYRTGARTENDQAGQAE